MFLIPVILGNQISLESGRGAQGSFLAQSEVDVAAYKILRLCLNCADGP